VVVYFCNRENDCGKGAGAINLTEILLTSRKAHHLPKAKTEMAGLIRSFSLHFASLDIGFFSRSHPAFFQTRSAILSAKGRGLPAHFLAPHFSKEGISLIRVPSMFHRRVDVYPIVFTKASFKKSKTFSAWSRWPATLGNTVPHRMKHEGNRKTRTGLKNAPKCF